MINNGLGKFIRRFRLISWRASSPNDCILIDTDPLTFPGFRSLWTLLKYGYFVSHYHCMQHLKPYKMESTLNVCVQQTLKVCLALQTKAWTYILFWLSILDRNKHGLGYYNRRDNVTLGPNQPSTRSNISFSVKTILWALNT